MGEAVLCLLNVQPIFYIEVYILFHLIRNGPDEP